jgi:sec-independent protein translocase protein TatA
MTAERAAAAYVRCTRRAGRVRCFQRICRAPRWPRRDRPEAAERLVLRSVIVKGEFAMGRLGLPEMLVILFIVILIFGASRLPDIGRGIGRGIKNFKEATREGGGKDDV